MGNCAFCKIIKGQLPCHKVYEDGFFFAFLDINPGVFGHTLVIPKKHYRWVYEVPEFDQYWLTVLKITKAIQRALQPSFITYSTYGLDVHHAHIHILPRSEANKKEVAPRQTKMSNEQREEISKKISQSL